MATKPLCSIPDCGKPSRKRGWCNTHYSRWRHHGDPTVVMKTVNGEPLRFYRETVAGYAGDDCLTWPYGTNGVGYGYLRVNGTRHYVHRYACEQVNGPPPTPEHEASHSCGKGHLGCVNPKHLEWKTSRQNQADRIAHGTHISGELHGRSKLTAEQVRTIRELAGTMPDRAIGELFSVTGSMVAKIRKGYNWSFPGDG